MNAKQRRQEKRRKNRLADQTINLLEQLIDELESGAQTFDEAREQILLLRAAIKKNV